MAANGYLQDCQNATGIPFRLVAPPVQLNEKPAVPERAPEFDEMAIASWPTSVPTSESRSTPFSTSGSAAVVA